MYNQLQKIYTKNLIISLFILILKIKVRLQLEDSINETYYGIIINTRSGWIPLYNNVGVENLAFCGALKGLPEKAGTLCCGQSKIGYSEFLDNLDIPILPKIPRSNFYC